MNKTQLITMDTLRTIGQGALGAMTFGAYHQYTTNRIMDLNNENVEIKHKYFMDRMEAQHKQEMHDMEIQQKTLNEKLNKLELLISEQQRKGWLW
jgi:hypothetical protein